ncbi:MAG: hypothetical protein ACK4HV_05105, partial [Parachlamydiaceae bacterium]
VPHLRDIRNWLFNNLSIVDRNEIISGLNYIFCGLNREAPPPSFIELIEAAYHLGSRALFERLKIELEINVHVALAKEDLKEIAKLLKELEASSISDDSDLIRLSDKLAECLGRKFIDSVDREMRMHAYRCVGVPKLIFNASRGGAFKVDELFYHFLNNIESLKTVHFIGVGVSLKKLPRRLLHLTLKHCSFEGGFKLSNAPMGLKSLAVIECGGIDSHFFIGMPPVIEKLSIIGIEGLDDRIADYLPVELTHLDLSGSLGISDSFFMNVPKSLKRLSVKNIVTITDDAIKRISCLNLAYLNIQGTRVSDEAVYHIPKTITHLCAGECITDAGLLSLSINLPRLFKLELCGNKRISSKGISQLSKSIIELNLTSSSVKDQDMVSLPVQLRALNVSGTKISKPILPIGLLSLDVNQSYSSDLNYLNYTKTLIHFSTNFIKDSDLSCVPRAVLSLTLDFSQINNLDHLPPNLLVLNLSFCRSLDVKELSKVPKTLRMIDITDTSFDLERAKSYLPLDCVIIRGTEIHVIG